MRNGFATLIETVQGNYGFNLPFTLTDNAGVPLDITNVTSLTFKGQLDSDNAVQFTGSMDVVSGPAGTCYYTVKATDFAAAGTWNCQIVAVYTGETLTFTGILVTVDSQLPI